MILLSIVLLAQIGLGGQGGFNTYPQNNPVISAVTESPDATTVVLQWTTNIASDSRGSCGSETAADNATQSLTTSHEIIVAGLVPSTGYTCTVQSGSTTTTISATTTALAASTPITGISVGTPTEYSGVNTDTMYNFESNDGNTYFIGDDVDGNGFSGTQTSAVSLNKFTTIPTAAVLVNALTGYGNCCTLTTPDGLSPKGQGLFGMGGNLYMTMNRQQQGQANYDLQFSPTIIKSSDHGATWNYYQNPATAASTGTNNNPVTLTPFSSASTPTNFGASSFVIYGADDGTNGYLVADNRVDNADAYVYGFSNGQTSDGLSTWDDGDSIFLWRVARANLENAGTLDTRMIQCWVSGDGTLDSNWTTNLANCGAVITNTGKLSLVNMQYIPALNRYILLTWYYPSGLGTTSSSTWLAYDCAHPWGACTLVSTITSSTIGVSGAYGPVVIQADALAATSGSTTMHVLFTSDFKVSYDVYSATMTVSH